MFEVANKMYNKGFETEVTEKGLVVSLNRPISIFEVERALYEVTTSREFSLAKVAPNKVLVK
jgi:hypothetical protein